MNIRQDFVSDPPLRIAVIGAGISGLSAAWLLSGRHDVTLFEGEHRLGGHSNTVEVAGVAVDTGFIVYNEATYPNLTALFETLDVPTRPTDMSFSVSLDDGRLEYAGGTDLRGLFAQPRNLVSPRFAFMLSDLLRFYRNAPRDLPTMGLQSLDSYLDTHRYGDAFRQDHLYPMAAAIWSTPAADVGHYPAAAFVRFCANHGLLQVTNRPVWRTVVGGSRSYVARLREAFRGRVVTGCPVRSVRRTGARIVVDAGGSEQYFDQVLIATHADQALAMLDQPSAAERELLGAFRYSRNEAVLHSDFRLMPRRRGAWAAWNYLADRRASTAPCVTYWMNRLQHLPEDRPLFVTLNPIEAPDPATVAYRTSYDHPLFDAETISAQRRLWALQGQGRVWFCGAYFGAGFHEDGLQAGLAAAEEMGDVRRPWEVADESSRIVLPRHQPMPEMREFIS